MQETKVANEQTTVAEILDALSELMLLSASALLPVCCSSVD